MSESEIRDYSASYPGLELYDPDDQERLIATKGDTRITLWFDEDRLTAHRVSWSHSFMKVSSRPKVDLCSGEQFVELAIVGPSSYSGSPVEIDGQTVGILSSAGTLTVFVTVGEHQLVVMTPEGPWSDALQFGSDSSGYHRLPIP